MEPVYSAFMPLVSGSRVSVAWMKGLGNGKAWVRPAGRIIWLDRHQVRYEAGIARMDEELSPDDVDFVQGSPKLVLEIIQGVAVAWRTIRNRCAP
jgi:hypothetical protein